LGAVHLVLCDVVEPAAGRPGPEGFGIGTAVVDGCMSLVEGTPVRVRAAHALASGLRSVVLEYDNGRAIAFRWRRAPVSRPVLRLQLDAEGGHVEVRPPRRLAWRDPAGRHALVVPRGRSLGQALLERFVHVLRGDAPAEPSLEEACQALGWLRRFAAAESGPVGS
jgi:hypothetical protein